MKLGFDYGGQMKVVKKYSMEVRKIVSNLYQEKVREKAEVMHERNRIMHDLDQENILHRDYLRLKQELEFANNKYITLSAEIEILDRVREICLKVADDLL